MDNKELFRISRKQELLDAVDALVKGEVFNFTWEPTSLDKEFIKNEIEKRIGFVPMIRWDDETEDVL